MNIQVGVVGTVFLDCKGFAAANYIPLGRNVGSVRFVHGGVGRNVAENIARLGVPVSLLSSRDGGASGAEICHRLDQAGVDTSFLAVMDECGMGIWLAIMDEQGELAGSISQMPDLRGISESIERRGLLFIKKSSHVALELDLNETITKRVLEMAKAEKRPVYGLPGNLEVILKAPDVLAGLECFVCNHIEAGRISGNQFDDTEPGEVLSKIPAFTKDLGLKSAVITLGPNGCVFWDAINGDAGIQPAIKVNVVDTCGAGDAFFSGALTGLAQGASLGQSVLLGTRAAACTVQSVENTCLTLGELGE